jgi:hypothetical protein
MMTKVFPAEDTARIECTKRVVVTENKMAETQPVLPIAKKAAGVFRP